MFFNLLGHWLNHFPKTCGTVNWRLLKGGWRVIYSSLSSFGPNGEVNNPSIFKISIFRVSSCFDRALGYTLNWTHSIHLHHFCFSMCLLLNQIRLFGMIVCKVYSNTIHINKLVHIILTTISLGNPCINIDCCSDTQCLQFWGWHWEKILVMSLYVNIE